MTANLQISFGDRVRVRSDSLTTRLGLAESIGVVYGESTPSVTGVDVIGETAEDRALNVFFEQSYRVPSRTKL